MRPLLRTLTLLAAAACGASDGSTGPDSGNPPGTSPGTPTTPVTPPRECPAAGVVPNAMTVLGCGNLKPARITAEIAVRGSTAYTTTYGNAPPSAIYVWDVSGDAPAIVDSVLVDGATTLGDVAISPDGKHLVVATEFTGGSIVIFGLEDPRKPKYISRFGNSETSAGVHTAEVGTVDGKLYAFLSVNRNLQPRLVVVDLSDPASPRAVHSRVVGTPVVHDTFLRDGFLFLGLWNEGLAIWDVGGGGRGQPAAPVEVGIVPTVNGRAHNVWWLKDPVTGSSRYAFVGEEAGGVLGQSTSGDIHVVDVSNMAAPREVAFYTVPGAGTHNFSADEQNGVLYAAYYNGGVRALDVRGDLGTCSAAQRSIVPGSAASLCDLTKMGRELAVGLTDRRDAPFVWGVQYEAGFVYASDMFNGIWKLRAVTRPASSP